MEMPALLLVILHFRRPESEMQCFDIQHSLARIRYQRIAKHSSSDQVRLNRIIYFVREWFIPSANKITTSASAANIRRVQVQFPVNFNTI